MDGLSTILVLLLALLVSIPERFALFSNILRFSPPWVVRSLVPAPAMNCELGRPPVLEEWTRGKFQRNPLVNSAVTWMAIDQLVPIHEWPPCCLHSRRHFSCCNCQELGNSMRALFVEEISLRTAIPTGRAAPQLAHN